MSEKKIRILIGSPVRRNPEILKRFLTSLSNLEQNSYEAVFFFVDNNDDSASSELLHDFSSRHAGTIIERVPLLSDYICDDHTTHHWNEQLTWVVASYKNKMIQYAQEQQLDGLFLVDSDVLPHPHTVEQLLKAKVDIVSEVFWSQAFPDRIPTPNVWIQDHYNLWEQRRDERLDAEQIAIRTKAFLDTLQNPGLYEVGGLGGCTLMSRRSLEAGVNFEPISNLSFLGEDRHFCVRAAALGISLYVDTHFPAYHVYRNSDVPGADDFLAHHKKLKASSILPEKNSDEETSSTNQPCEVFVRRHSVLTLTMIVKNEAGRYLKRALQEHRNYIGQAVIIDDGSTDETVDVVMDTLRGIPVKLIRNSESRMFTQEGHMRKLQWEETLRTDPTWILNLDADEWFERRFAEELEGMLYQDEVDLYCFRLYDFWSETHYREDKNEQAAHSIYRPYLFRHRSSFQYHWELRSLHSSRFPKNIWDFPHKISQLRLKHFGWAKEEERAEKVRRYLEVDPDGAYAGRKGAYDVYLAPVAASSLVEWIE